jgi:hypothetical protein
VPLSRWSTTDLACEAVGRGITDTISASTVRRVLAADVLKPWQHPRPPTSPTGPPACWTSTSGSGTGSHSLTTST